MTSASIAMAKINIINMHIANIVISLINRKKNQGFLMIERLSIPGIIARSQTVHYRFDKKKKKSAISVPVLNHAVIMPNG